MPSRTHNELDAQLDDAKTAVEELQYRPETHTTEKLDELRESLEEASDTLDDLGDQDA
jgi:hypothetical protein